LKKTIVSLLLLIAVMWLTTYTRAQEFTLPTAITVSSTDDHETADLLHSYRAISALSLPARRNFFRSSSATQKSQVAKIYLAVQLVRRPDLNKEQARIMLDAISLSNAAFFAAMDGSPAQRAKANEALRSLARRAHGTLPLHDASELFANIGVNKAEDEILKKFSDISALPLNKRKAFFRAVSPKDKSDLWRTHLALFLVRTELTDWQRETVLYAMSLATPGWFEVKSSDAAWKSKVGDLLRSLEARILTAFSFEDGAKIFATLGDSTATAKRGPTNTFPVLLTSINYKPADESRPFKQWTINRYAEQDIELERSSCQCSTESDWCGLTSRCTGTGSCNTTESGCGTLWSYPCNGALCQ
jgi:hypothetical protein